MALGKTPRTQSDWTRLAHRRLAMLLKAAQTLPGLKRLGPAEGTWQIGVKFVDSRRMTQLNGKFRGKRKTTDILSFPPPEPIRRGGYLGELIICLPIMKRQAVERKLQAADELQVLLVHGVLHLLGLDHEDDESGAKRMARWEAMLLSATGHDLAPGLIERTGWGNRD